MQLNLVQCPTGSLPRYKGIIHLQGEQAPGHPARTVTLASPDIVAWRGVAWRGVAVLYCAVLCCAVPCRAADYRTWIRAQVGVL